MKNRILHFPLLRSLSLSGALLLASVAYGAPASASIYYPDQKADRTLNKRAVIAPENTLQSNLSLGPGSSDLADKGGSNEGTIRWSSYDPALNTKKYLQMSVIAAGSGEPFSLSTLSFNPVNFASRPGRIEIRFSKSESGFDSDYVTVYRSPDLSKGRFSGASDRAILIDLKKILDMPGPISEGYFRFYIYDVYNPNIGTADPGAWNGLSELRVTVISAER